MDREAGKTGEAVSFALAFVHDYALYLESSTKDKENVIDFDRISSPNLAASTCLPLT